MPGIKTLTNVWNTVKELDLRPLRQDALREVQIAVIGKQGAGKHALAAQMRHDPSHPGAETRTPLLLSDLDSAEELVQKSASVDLIILMLDAAQSAEASDDTRERSLAREWADYGKKVLVFINHSETVSAEGGESQTPAALDHWVDWGKRRVILGSVGDSNFLLTEFVPIVMEMLPDQHLALGRHFPLFRVPIARQLINETCLSNAAYAFSTGLAEIVPVLDVPLNVTDVVVLSKTQAFLVYKLGLALGLSTRWEDYVTEFGSILGGGFLWRQLARSLVGLIPAWGIAPKVAVSYAGTYVVGNVVLQWYLTGRHISRQQMRQLYTQAFVRGKNLARSLLKKVPRPRLGKRKKAALPPPQEKQDCANCGESSAADAHFCQYCGQAFT